MTMTRRAAVAAMMLASAAIVVGCAHDDKKPKKKVERLVIPSVSVAIEADPEAQQAGKRVDLVVQMTNTGFEEMKYDETASLTDWEINIYNDVGEKPELTEAGQAAKGKAKAFFGMMRPTLEPGKTAETRFELTKLFDLSKPGKYRVTVKRLFRNKAGEVMSKAISNTVEFSLVGA